MAMFQAEIAFLFELVLFAAGLVLLHYGRQVGAPLLKAAALALLIGSVVTALCTGYFSVRYHVQGEFDSAYPRHPGAHMGMHHPRAGAPARMRHHGRPDVEAGGKPAEEEGHHEGPGPGSASQ